MIDTVVLAGIKPDDDVPPADPALAKQMWSWVSVAAIAVLGLDDPPRMSLRTTSLFFVLWAHVMHADRGDLGNFPSGIPDRCRPLPRVEHL